MINWIVEDMNNGDEPRVIDAEFSVIPAVQDTAGHILVQGHLPTHHTNTAGYLLETGNVEAFELHDRPRKIADRAGIWIGILAEENVTRPVINHVLIGVERPSGFPKRQLIVRR